ncbi:hypothetical protein [Runella sp. CRIBMP]|nr:hypothetical protein [Runella sp. CRIBMP]
MKTRKTLNTKKKYQTPKLKKLGNVKNLTSATGSGDADGMTGLSVC